MYIERFTFGGITLEMQGEEAWLPSETCSLFHAGEGEEADHTILLDYQESLPRIPAAARQRNNLYCWKDQEGHHTLKNYGEKQFSYGIRKGGCTRIFFSDRYRDTMYSQAILEAANLFEIMMDYGQIVLHASYLLVRGQALLFSGPSGIGKSTQADLWHRYGDARIINGDRCLVDTERLRANGIFYSGTSGICHNISAPLRAIVLLGQKPDNILRPASGTEAFGSLLHQCAYYPWDGAMTARAMELVANLVQGVEVYRLECRPEKEAVRLVERELFGYSVKSLSPRHARMSVGEGLYDTPLNEGEVGRKPRENPN